MKIIIVQILLSKLGGKGLFVLGNLERYYFIMPDNIIPLQQVQEDPFQYIFLICAWVTYSKFLLQENRGLLRVWWLHAMKHVFNSKKDDINLELQNEKKETPLVIALKHNPKEPWVILHIPLNCIIKVWATDWPSMKCYIYLFTFFWTYLLLLDKIRYYYY